MLSLPYQNAGLGSARQKEGSVHVFDLELSLFKEIAHKVIVILSASESFFCVVQFPRAIEIQVYCPLNVLN